MDWITRDFLDGLGVVGICVLVMLMLAFGKGLALQREVKDRDKTIEYQRLTIDNLTASVAALTGAAQVSARSLQKVSQAAEEIVGGEGS